MEKLRQAASRDDLTGLYNRRTFEQVIEELLERDDAKFTLILCDVDNFKQVNNTLGHHRGDEFAVLLPCCDRIEASDVAERLGGDWFVDRELGHPVTLTLGVASYPDDGVSLEELYKRADKRLYQGKESGKAVVVTG